MQKKILYALTILNTHVVAQEPPQSLPTLVVTATRTASPLADVPASVTLISREELLNKGSQNVFDALRDTPGISVQGIGTGGRKAISLRGLDSKHSLILIDGKRLPSSNDSFGPNTDYHYDWLPLAQIERIEVVRGPMSVLYGSDALGGVVNIITRKPSKDWTGQINALGYLNDSDDGAGQQLSAYASGALAHTLKLQIHAAQTRRAAVADTRAPALSALEGREQQQIGVALDWQALPEHTIKLEHTQGQDERWYDTETRREQLYQSRYDIQRQHTALGWDAWLGETNALLRGYQSRIETSNSTTQGVAPTAPQTLRERVLEAGINLPWGETHLLSAGAEYREERLQHPQLVGGQAQARLFSVYLQDDIELSAPLRLTIGLRQDHFESFGDELSPRIALGWELAPAWTARVSYGHGFRSPNIKQIAQDYSFAAGMFVIQSNPALQPETNDAWELGIHYAQTAWELDAAVFDNRVKNLIDTRFQQTLANGLQQWRYDNIAEAQLRGLEITGKWQLNAAFSLSANYQYLEAKDADGERLEARPRHTLNTSLNWQRAGWQARVSHQYLAAQTLVPAGARNMEDLPDYGVWQVHLRNAITPNISVTVGIENLTDVSLAQKSANFRHEIYPRSLWLALRSTF